jgi:hypothetical protein
MRRRRGFALVGETRWESVIASSLEHLAFLYIAFSCVPFVAERYS